MSKIRDKLLNELSADTKVLVTNAQKYADEFKSQRFQRPQKTTGYANQYVNDLINGSTSIINEKKTDIKFKQFQKQMFNHVQQQRQFVTKAALQNHDDILKQHKEMIKLMQKAYSNAPLEILPQNMRKTYVQSIVDEHEKNMDPKTYEKRIYRKHVLGETKWNADVQLEHLVEKPKIEETEDEAYNQIRKLFESV
ncbi:Hypothetical_protein [Hexamita inflata]|uniref:Hypothetical_protein n=1 Tax=Hexamita inflata TaxID=28002 RepID=A0ABP1IL73_9EUKA